MVMSEVPRFLNICAHQRGFNIRKKDARLSQSAFPGMVVASAEALYFVPDLEIMPRSALGGLFGRLLQAPRLGDLGGAMDLTEVPAEITEHPDWPVTWNKGPLFVLPREAVESLRTSFLLGGIEMMLPDVRILVFTPIFRRKQMAAYLAALGWEVAGVEPDSSLVPQVDTSGDRPTARTVEKRKRAFTTLLLGLVFVLGSLGLLLWQLSWVRSALAGPVSVTPVELRQLTDPDTLSNPWVTLVYDRSVDTGIGVVRTGLLNTILGEGRSRFVLIAIQDRWLIADVPENHFGNRVTGYLTKWSTPLRLEEVSKIRTQFPGHPMLPFQLDAHYAYRRECVALICLVIVFFLAGVFLIVRGRWLYRQSPS
jgi:hypothetical protein